uniref:DUF433 domain-containing protein n=1 Tax=Candidatus Kentrum sp. TC TaxID=2126339 RepID=A0A450YZ48_9GAMM|nr:MAG: Protein of unknown function (DUF433) [Candidatus Kentron sp. TC]VFK46792.1 MAG: Protein of unknown function (DUF433) [Candidatus Kentron sp. TC]VFK55563.1 MAG: Protein of unknown function (DUF433) [Candidatus Kentron sp. TC]
MNAKFEQRITFDPEQCGGRACTRGMRIRVADILEMLAKEIDEREISGTKPSK